MLDTVRWITADGKIFPATGYLQIKCHQPLISVHSVFSLRGLAPSSQ
jgi:hypothetical protein